MKQKLLGNYLLPHLLSVFVALSVGVPTVAFAGNNNVTGNSITNTEPSAQFSADGSTLVITASGDLTSYSAEVKTVSKRKFTIAAATKITTQQNTSSFVKAGDEVTQWGSYYEASVTYKQVASDDISTYLGTPYEGKYTVPWDKPSVYMSVAEGTEGSTTITVDGEDVTVKPLAPGSQVVFDASKDKLYVVYTATFTQITSIDQFFSSHPEYVENEYTTSKKSFSDMVKAKLDEGGYSSVRFVKAEGGADITISLDQMKSILSYSGKSNLQDNASLIDFSEVGTISGLGAAAVPNDVNYVSVVLPNALSDADAKKIADAQKDANWYWLSDDGTSMNIKGMYPQKYSATASVAMSDKVKSIIVMGPVQWGLTDNVKAFDIAGIDNLDLHTITNSEGYAPTIDPFTTFSGFSNIKRVALCGGTDLSTLEEKDYNSSVQVFQSLPFATNYAGQVTTDHVLQTRVLKQDVITSLSHFTPEDFKSAVEFVFSGNLSCNDLTFFSGVESKRVNLTNVNLVTSTFTDKTKFEALEEMKNDNIEYLALPNADADTTATLFPTLKENMPNLKGVGYFNGNTFTAQTWTDRGGVCILTAMMQSKLIPSGNTSNVKSIRISGPVNAEDLGRESTNVDANGHLTFKITEAKVQDDAVDPLYQKTITSSTSDDGYALSHGAFPYANFVSADLSGAEIDEKYPNDLCLSLLACYSNCETIALPRTGKEIPVGCFANFHELTSLCIPESYECIRSLAFQNVNALRMITTTSGGSIVSLGDSTMVISSNMKLIETGAFSNVEKIVDVYCRGNEAPEAQRWAFNTTMTYGNSGFSPSAAITRKNYVNSGKPITVLHFPTSCTPDQVKKYTDPTREYSITDGQGTTDGKGHYLVWPNQSEFIRSYVQGHTGYTWKAWNTQREPFNNGLVYALNEGMQAHQTQADSLWKMNDSPSGTKFYDSSDKTAQKDYRGWHEFALVANYNYEEPDPIYDFGNVKDNNWWTLCLPFDMTKKNLRLVFGNPNPKDGIDIDNTADYPRICELVGVERNLATHSIVLQFGKDLVMNTSETDATVPGEDAVIMKAGHPYLIKPKMPDAESESEWVPSRHVLKYSQMNKNFSELLAQYGADGVGGILRDNIKDVKAVAATKAGASEEKDTYYYRFIATFASWYIPQYSYFLGWYKNGPAWWWKPTTTSTLRQWAPNTCIILVTKNSDEDPKFVTSAGVQEVAHWDVTRSGFEYCADDTFADMKVSGSKRAGMLFDFVGDPGSTTGISHVVIDTSKADPSAVAPVYNLNGQLVSRDGSIEGLGKGIYIKNGKKFIVK